MNNKDGSNEIHLFSSEGLGSLLIEHKEKKKNLQEENIMNLASHLMGEDSPFLDNLDEKIKSLSSEDLINFIMIIKSIKCLKFLKIQ